MIHIAIVGYGVIGSGLAELIARNYKHIKEHIKDDIDIKYIVDIRDFKGHPLESKFIKDFNTVLNDPEVTIVAEMIGGSHPAYDFCLAALKAGKNVVTSNKEVVSKFGPELLAAAYENKVRYLFEASVGGGIPIIRPLKSSLVGNEITEITAILNGTTNYILTQMTKSGKPFDEALKEAQMKGYAEAKPSADIDGLDSCRKICILSAVVFGKLVPAESVYTRGISEIEISDIKAAAAENCVIKLISRAVKLDNDKMFLSVEPYKVKLNNPLANIDDVYNGILVKGNAVGDVMFSGKGAGSMPTASAVLSDIFDLIDHAGRQPMQSQWSRSEKSYTHELPDDIAAEMSRSLGLPLEK